MSWAASYGADAIQQLIRQRMLDQIAAQERKRRGMNDDREFQLRQQEMDERRQEREQARQDHLAAGQAAEAGRRDRQIQSLAGNIVQETPPGTSLSRPVAGVLRLAGRGSLVKENPDYAYPPMLEQGNERETNIGDQPGDVYQGTANQQRQIRTDETNAENARRDDARQAARDEAQGRHERAMETQGGATKDLQNQLAELRLQTERDKLANAQRDRENAATNAQQATETALDLIDRLGGNPEKQMGEHPGLDKLYGAYEMRGWTQDAQDAASIRDQLVATLTVPNLGALKGPMSDKDILFVKSLATRLGNSKISGPEARKALAEARTFLQAKLPPRYVGPMPPAEPTPGAPPAAPTIPDAGGKPRGRYNPATGKIER